MFQRSIAVVLCGFLAACGDPLAGLDRLRDVELAEDAAGPAALPSEAEIARDGFFGTPAAEGEEARALDVATPSTRKGGLLGLLRRAVPKDSQADAVAAAVAQSEGQLPVEEPPVEETAEVAAVTPVTDAPAKAGFLGRLLGRTAGTSAREAALAPDAQSVEEPVQLAALTPVPDIETAPKRRGLFGRKSQGVAVESPRNGPDARDVDYGTVLPFGEVARSCASRGRPLGRKIERAPAGGYTLFDSKPDSAAPRTFYITGFNDGCPRQLTAANVLLGSASLYEQLHYGPGAENLPQGETDKAYARVKRRICGVSQFSPCGAKIGKMEKSTFFVTAYNRFGTANTWSELLVHDGEVLAAAIKSYN